MKRHQSGITLIGFIVILGIAGIFIYVGMKLIPMYTEYYGVKQALKGLALEPGINNSSPDHIRSLFTRRLYVNYSENVESKHVKIERPRLRRRGAAGAGPDPPQRRQSPQRAAGIPR